jgi:hypothetical protein
VVLSIRNWVGRDVGLWYDAEVPARIAYVSYQGIRKHKLSLRVLPRRKRVAGGNRAKARQPCIVKNGIYMVKTLTRKLTG